MKCNLIALLCTACLFSCKHSKYDREAIKLNDSAVAIQMNNRTPDRKRSLDESIALLNKAIKIDSNYVVAYYNKFIFQNQLKYYKDATATGSKLIKLKPRNEELKLMLGETYERAGDTVTAKRYYGENLSYVNKVLDTMNVNNRSYDNFMHGKVVDLILLHQLQNAHDLIAKLYKKGTDLFFINRYQKLNDLNATRTELLYGDTVSNTAVPINNRETDATLMKRIKLIKPTNAKNN